MKRFLYILFNIFIYVICLILVIYMVSFSIQKIKNPNKTTSFCEYKTFIIASNSMTPNLNIGDIVFIKENEIIHNGDIITYKLNNSTVTHRVIEIINSDNKKMYKTKGDANNMTDTELVSEDQIEGKYIFKIAKLGIITSFFQGKNGIILLVVLTIILLILITPKKRKSKSIKNGKHAR